MKLVVEGGHVITSLGSVAAPYPVLEAREIEGRALVLYDYMAFPSDAPARNLFAYELTGKELWRAEHIGWGATDAYTNFISEVPFVVGNFAGFSCTINIMTGMVVKKTFTK